MQPVINTEEQLIFVCHLIGPTLNRFNVERPRCISELTVILYEMLEQVNHVQTHLKQMDPVCDLMYPFSLFNIYILILIYLFRNIYFLIILSNLQN